MFSGGARLGMSRITGAQSFATGEFANEQSRKMQLPINRGASRLPQSGVSFR